MDLRVGINLIVVREEVEAIFIIIGSLRRNLWKSIKEEHLIRGSRVNKKKGFI